MDSSSVNAFAAGPFPPSTALTYLPCKGAVTSSCSPHPFLHGPQLLKLAWIGSRPFSKIVNDFSLLFFPLSILKSWSASPGSPHLPHLPLQLPHHSTSSTQGNPSLPRQVLGFSQGFIFSRLPSLQHIFLPHLFAPSPLSSVQFSSVAQLCLTLSDPMNRSTPGLPVHHQLLESTQTHAH